MTAALHDTSRLLPPQPPTRASKAARAEYSGMDAWLNNLESLGMAIAQRRMTDAQRHRLYGLLERIYGDARRRT